jgi:hypothetical protein
MSFNKRGSVAGSPPCVRRGDFYQNSDSVIKRQRIFRQRYKNGRQKNFREPRLLQQTNKKTGGAVRTVRTPEGTADLRATIGHNPKRSARRHSVALTISSRSLQHILRSDLHFHNYKLNSVQELASRNTFCDQFVTLMNEHLVL